MRSPVLALTTLLLSWNALADPLNMTISGRAAEKVPLETLVPSPDIPTADTLSLSLDGGASAAGEELEPMSVAKAALDMDLTQMPMPNLSAIPDAPYIVQAVPTELERQRDNKLRRNEKRIRFTNWEFTVVDERNTICHRVYGDGFPPQPLVWDGRKDDQFILKPNRVYFSTLRLTAHGEPDRTIAGESVRFMAFLRQDGDDTVIEIGERIYKQDEAQFSPESKIYLDDLASRFSHNMIFYQEASESEWKVVIREPESKQHLASGRRILWKTSLEKMLGKNLPEKNFVLKTEGEESSVSIVFPRSKPPLTDLALRGNAKANLDPIIDEMKSIAKISENKKTVFVDLRHDRIFNPGSAYIKDSALPLVMKAISETQKLMKANTEEKGGKKLMGRSDTHKLPGGKKEIEDEPKLTATRSKVVFMLLARETLAAQ